MIAFLLNLFTKIRRNELGVYIDSCKSREREMDLLGVNQGSESSRRAIITGVESFTKPQSGNIGLGMEKPCEIE
ncbi:hypothetical protein CEXT_646771 [Caerostris extrusa]|uniref:Uncharacterized protein n=1 Tax=Caerostris extrusa TaxID=172846 RepID=A0AAV4XKS3_CAEEX|nr:hypothetical protein CEXT_646771 [Caerostris extrusa]